jgi:hypothetical protein
LLRGLCREREGRGWAALTRVLQSNNQIGDDGAVRLGEGLKVNSSLQNFSLVRHFVFLSLICLLRGLCREREGVQRRRHVSHLFAVISILWPIQHAWLLFSFARLQKSRLSKFRLLRLEALRCEQQLGRPARPSSRSHFARNKKRLLFCEGSATGGLIRVPQLPRNGGWAADGALTRSHRPCALTAAAGGQDQPDQRAEGGSVCGHRPQ